MYKRLNKRVTSFLMAILLVVGSVLPAAAKTEKGFVDMPNDWSTEYLEEAVARGVMKGNNKNEIRAKASATRAEFATMVNRLEAYTEEADLSKFKDVKKTDWFYEELAKSVKAGVVTGVTATELKPNKAITREQAFTVLARAKGIESNTDHLSDYEDGKQVSEWSKKAINGLIEEGILEGHGNNLLKVKAEINRAEVAALLMRAYAKTEPVDDLAAAKEAKLAEIEKVVLTEEEKAGMTEESIEEAEAKLEELKEAAKKAVEAAETVEEVEAVEVNKEEALDLLVEKDQEIESITAINSTSFKVVFKNEVDLKKEDITVEGLEVKAVEILEDKKTVVVETSEMEYEKDYKVSVKIGEDTLEGEFTSKGVTELWELKIEAPKSLKSDGIATGVIKFSLLDAEGNVDTKANNVVLDLNATFGNLSQKRLTMQKGYGEVILRSEFNEAEVVSKIDAQIIEAEGKYKDLIGKVVAESAYVVFNDEGEDTGEQALIKSLVSANSNEADRVTLIFDEPITEEDLYEKNEDGVLTKRDNIKISQDSKMTEKKDIKHVEISKKNPKAVIVYLDVRGEGKEANILRDNSDVYVTANIGKYGNDKKVSFKLTDARVANLTGVEAISNKELKVTFSEGILESTFVIDGRHDDSKFDVKYGDITEDGVDERHIVTITLNEKYQEPDKKDEEHIYPAGYFKPGKHSIQASTIKDFAAHTDDKNIGTTQTLSFEVEEDNTEVTIDREVQSPEQFLIKFDREVEFKKVDADGKATKKSTFEEVAELVFKNKDGKWETVLDNIGDGKHFQGKLDEKNDPVNELYVVEGIEKGQYLMEMATDWTVIYDTKTTKDNYYNDEFAVRFAKGTIVNPANGKSNEEAIIVNLTEGTVLEKPDTTSPVISSMKKADGFDAVTKPIFDVTMSEPVKLLNKEKAAINKEGATLAQGQESLPETKVEFLGKDKDGKTRTFIGKVNGFKDKFDKIIEVQWSKEETGEDKEKVSKDTPQTIVDAGGSTEWTLVIRSISDDIGNTAATVTEKFELEKSEEIPSEEVFKVVDEGGTATGQDGQARFAVKGEKHDDHDKVTIEFTQEVAVTGNGSAVDTKNYNLNGKDLPAGTKILIDGEGNVIDIILPVGTLGKEKGVITLAGQIQSKAGLKIVGDLAFTFDVEDKTTKKDEEPEA